MTAEFKDVDMTAAEKIQTKVAEYAHAGYEIFATEDDNLAGEYTEGFYDSCVLYWEEDGFDRDQVRETVDAAVRELAKVYA